MELRDTGNFGFLLPPTQIIPTGEFKLILRYRCLKARSGIETKKLLNEKIYLCSFKKKNYLVFGIYDGVLENLTLLPLHNTGYNIDI
mgnify:CR=1 FL=1